MKILISSLIDLQKSAHNSRLHQFLRHLVDKHEITVICINDGWKEKWDNKSNDYNKDFKDIFDKIKILYLTEKDISPILQDVFSPILIKQNFDKIDFSEFDIHYSYNSLTFGYIIAKKLKSLNINTIYDIADDLPEMISTSPQIPSLMQPFGKILGTYLLNKNIQISKKVTLTTELLGKQYNIPEAKTEIIPNGVETDLFKYTPSKQLQEKLELSNYFVVGHVGVLREWIDLEPLLIAVKELSSKFRIKLLIVGGGIGFGDTKKLVSKYDISDNVVFTGTIPYHQVPNYISCMDVGVIPFKGDLVAKNSVPLKLFEYMACEKPVISTNVDAIRQKFAEDILFVEDSDGYYEQILKLYNDTDLMVKMGQNGKNIVRNNYEWSKISERLETILEINGKNT